MLSGIGDLERKCVKKLGQCPWVLFTGAQKTTNLACLLCTIGGEKDPMPFTKVVDQCKIYNFGIQMFVHFSSKILSKTLLNSASLNGVWLLGIQSAPSCRCRAPAAPWPRWARTPRPF
jgi:hypothetical protein